jgi:hypothetical protein
MSERYELTIMLNKKNYRSRIKFYLINAHLPNYYRNQHQQLMVHQV